MTFAEQPRCLRVAWALDHVFNANTGFANASNTYLAMETGLTPRNVQKALEALEADRAIVRSVTVHRGGQRWRVVYPGTSIMDVGVTSTVDVGGHVHQVDVQNLRRVPRRPKTQLGYAQLAALARERGLARASDMEPTPVAAERDRGQATAPDPEPVPVAAKHGCPSNGARCNGGAPPASNSTIRDRGPV